MADRHDLIVTLEENAVRGGAGAGVAEVLSDHGQAIPLLILGLPDQHIGQGEPAEVLARCGLDAAGIINSIRNGLPPELARTLESA
jgi:1-deoxy-D-xylulose-5-phosphate synthase